MIGDHVGRPLDMGARYHVRTVEGYSGYSWANAATDDPSEALRLKDELLMLKIDGEYVYVWDTWKDKEVHDLDVHLDEEEGAL